MIRVSRQPEYPAFGKQVRKPGLAFLRSNPSPSTSDFRKHNYWNRARENLFAAYSGLCAYTSMHLVDTGSVDHFLPKTKYPHLAYEWDNYRLARQKINARKSNTEEVLDPFKIQTGWFVLDLPSCLVRAAQEVERDLRIKVNQTINILGLNNDDRLVQERCDWLVWLADGHITIDFLDCRYPFLAAEVRRQGVMDRLKTIFGRIGKGAN